MWPTGSNVNLTCRKCRQRDDHSGQQYDPPEVESVRPAICYVAMTCKLWHQSELTDVTSIWTIEKVAGRKWRQCDTKPMWLSIPTVCVTSICTIESGVNVTMWLSMGPTGCVTSMWPTGCDVNMNHRKWRICDHATFNRTSSVWPNGSDVNVTYRKWRQCAWWWAPWPPPYPPVRGGCMCNRMSRGWWAQAAPPPYWRTACSWRPPPGTPQRARTAGSPPSPPEQEQK
jgi:hypothetical protein